MNNIDAFDMMTATIFAKLYEQFPKKLIIECDRFCSDVKIDGYDLESKTELCKHTMTFLQENDFIISNSDSGSTAWAYVTLTIKGLNALKSEPKSLKKNQTIGKRLIEAVQSGSSEVAVSMAQNALIALLK